MRAWWPVLEILCSLAVLMTSRSRAARVVSGQTVCQGGPKQPCYKIAYFRDVSSRVAFWEAARACEVDGGSMLSIESADEQKHTEQLLQELSRSTMGSGLGPSIADGDFWIGLTRVDDSQGEHGSLTTCPDLYRWMDGSVSQFRNWYYDEPSCGGEACVVMYHQPTAQPGLGGPYLYQWNDDRCTMKHNFICKYKPESNLVTEHVERPASRDTDHSTEHEEIKTSAVNEKESVHVTMAGPSSMLLIYVVIPTIPLLLLILVASGTCCFQMLSRSKPRTKTSVDQTTLWISKSPKSDSAIEV